MCATIGPTISFVLSHLIGRTITRWIFPNQMAWFSKQVEARRRNLFNFLLFLRITVRHNRHAVATHSLPLSRVSFCDFLTH